MKKNNLNNLSRNTWLHLKKKYKLERITAISYTCLNSSHTLIQTKYFRSSLRNPCSNNFNKTCGLDTDRRLFENVLKNTKKINNVNNYLNLNINQNIIYKKENEILKDNVLKLSLGTNKILFKKNNNISIFKTNKDNHLDNKNSLIFLSNYYVLKGYFKPANKQNFTNIAKQFIIKENQYKNKILIDIGSQLITLSYKNFIIEQHHFFQIRKIYNQSSGKKTHCFEFLKIFCKFIFSSNDIGGGFSNELYGEQEDILNPKFSSIKKEANLSLISQGVARERERKGGYGTKVTQTYSKRLNLRLLKILIKNLSLNKTKKKIAWQLLNKQKNYISSNWLCFSKFNKEFWGYHKLFLLENKNLFPFSALKRDEKITKRTTIPQASEDLRKVYSLCLGDIKLITSYLLNNIKNPNSYKIKKKLKKNIKDNYQKNLKNLDILKNPINFNLKKNQIKDLNKNQLNFYEFLHYNFYDKFPYYNKFGNLKGLSTKDISFKNNKINPILTLKYTNFKTYTLSSLFLNLNFCWKKSKQTLFQNKMRYKEALGVPSIGKKDTHMGYSRLKKISLTKTIGPAASENFYWMHTPCLENSFPSLNGQAQQDTKDNLKSSFQTDNWLNNPLNSLNEHAEEEYLEQPYKKNKKLINSFQLKKEEQVPIRQTQTQTQIQTQTQNKILELIKQKKIGTYIPITILITIINRLINKKSIEYVFKTNNIYSSLFYLKYYWYYLNNHFYPNKNVLIKKYNINNKTNEIFIKKKEILTKNYLEKKINKKKNIKINKNIDRKDILYRLLTNKQNTLWNNNLSKKLLSNHWYVEYLKLNYYSKIINTNRINNDSLKKKRAMDKKKNIFEHKVHATRFNLQNKNNLEKNAVSNKKINIKGGYTKRIVSFFLYKKKPQPLNFNFNSISSNNNGISITDGNIIINLSSNKLVHLRTDIALYNSLHLINLTN